MLNLSPGNLIRMIDWNGDDRGLAVFMEMCPPYTILKDEEIPQGSRAGDWHIRALWDGRITLFGTYQWTAAPVEDPT